jgi:gas vesicle protein
MIIIILAVALLIALAGLGFEIGVASWSIRRADRYRRSEAAAGRTAERAIRERRNTAGRMESLDDYASKLSWLLNFLYNRYGKFADLEAEVNEGLKDVSGDTSVGELDAKCGDLKKALKIIRVTAKTFERMENLADSVNTQLSQIMEDFQDGEDDGKEKEESLKSPASGKRAEGEDAECPAPKRSETEDPEEPPPF